MTKLVSGSLARAGGSIAAAAASMLLATGACGNVRSADKQAGSESTHVAAAEADLNRLYESITGGPSQRSAVDYVGYRVLQDAQYQCIKRHGFDYPLPPFIDKESGYPLAGGTASSTWLAPLNSRYLTQRIRVLARFSAAQAGIAVMPSKYDNSSRSKGYREALRACESAGGNADQLAYPKDYALVGAYNSMVDSVVRKLDKYQSGYARCMNRAGFDVGTYEDLANRIMKRVPQNPVDVAHPTGAAAAAWTDLVNYEGRAVQADGVCRRPAHDAGYALLKPRLDRFEQVHAAALARLRVHWRGVQAKAEWYRQHPLKR